MKRYLSIILFLILGVVWVAVFQLPDSQLHLIFCDVGQGDASLISYQNQQILIDGGPNNRVLDCLSKNLPFYDRTIETVVLTHAEADHLTGLIEVIKRYQIRQIIVNLSAKETTINQQFKQLVTLSNIKIYQPQINDQIKIGPLALKILWPNQATVLGMASNQASLNEESLVAELVFGDFQALFTGDIDAFVEKQLDLGDIDLLKVAHHGSKTATTDEFLTITQPEMAIISVGKNSYGHPAEEVINRLNNFKTKILRTDLSGDIKITSNGQGFFIDN